MISIVLVLCCLGALVSSAPAVVYDIEDAETYFELFINTYNRTYSNVNEKAKRFEIFKTNLEHVNHRNQMEKEAVFGITRFSDLTEAEFKATYTCLKKPEGPSPCKPQSGESAGGPVPEEWDWRKQNKVSRVKDQSSCGSCWAFSTVGNIESQYAMVHNEIKEFSEGQLLDCSKSNAGCYGGWMEFSILDVQNMGGMMSEQDYPYAPKQQNCKFDKSKVQATVKGCTVYKFDNEDQLKDTLYNVGPLAIAVDGLGLAAYNKGIMDYCPNGPVSHAVLLVGYGTENGTPFWIIKNSWSDTWGESGYFRVKRNVNSCNIMDPYGLIVSATVA